MNVFSRLVIGCANWGQPYGHRKVTCPRAEQEKILEYAHCCGIETIHTKPEYGVDLSWIPTAFEVIEHYAGRTCAPYTRDDLPICTDGVKWDWVQVPYSPFNAHWGDWIAAAPNVTREVHVRSIFVQGKVFTSDEPVFMRFRQYAGQLGLPPGTLCIAFCLLNPHIDKVIVGVDSLGQLKENLRFFHRLNSFRVDDESIIDPREWPDVA